MSSMHVNRLIRVNIVLSLGIFLLSGTCTASAAAGVRIPRITTPPRLEDFEDIAPRGSSAQLAKGFDFIPQQTPPGEAATQRTHVYLGYEAANLYTVWV